PTPLTDSYLYIAVGIIGATVMPHNLYLHSALVQTRKIGADHKSIKRALKYNFIDSLVALNAAFFVNAAILVLAATVFFKTGNTEVARIEDAHRLLQPLLGTHLAPILFAVALIAAGQSSTVTGTLAGQIVMEGYLQIRLNPWLRRLLTRLIAIGPAVFIIGIYGEGKVDDLLVFSQVLLSVQLGFAVIPLIHFVSDKEKMGDYVIKKWVQIAAWLVALILVALNGRLVLHAAIDFMNSDATILAKVAVGLLLTGFVVLFFIMTFYPVFKKKQIPVSNMHGDIVALDNLTVKPTQKIGIALDFTLADEKLIAHALAQGQQGSNYVLIHVVESVSAHYLGAASDDEETRLDQERLSEYQRQLEQKGYQVSTALGFKNRTAAIVKIVADNKVDMLVMGAHGHKGIKDYIFGETIESVRHKLSIPVLIVNV
ncbi:MAG: divalent metal cation transporter, partial [Sediminibacterium sp.]|nr:divalent metal cation transporter [Sediminibacterium sp.]